jgi:hypothetical protein
VSHRLHETRQRPQRHPNAPQRTRMPPNAPEALARRENRRRRRVKIPPNAPQWPQMPPENAICENEPTAACCGTFGHARGGAVDRGLRQLTQVEARLRREPICQNEPTVSRDDTFGHMTAQRRGGAVDRGLRQLTQVDAGLRREPICQNEPTAPLRARVELPKSGVHQKSGIPTKSAGDCKSLFFAGRCENAVPTPGPAWNKNRFGRDRPPHGAGVR